MVVGQVAEADAHVMVYRSGDGDGDGNTHDGVRHGQWIEVAVLNEEQAGGETPDQGDRREQWIGQMSEREKDSRKERRGSCGFR